MASVKLLLYKSKLKSDGRYPIVLRIIKERKIEYLCLDWIYENEWDFDKSIVRRKHPSSKRLNNFIVKKRLEAEDLIFDFERDGISYSAKKVIKKLKGEQTKDFLSYSETYLEELRQQKKYSRYSADHSRFKNIKAYFSGARPSFSEIDIKFIHDLKTYLVSEVGISERTAMNSLILIRTIYNRAIAEGVADRKHYPFGKGKFKIKFPEVVKIGLNEDEISRIEKLDLEKDSAINHVRNVFLFSFYFAGMRVSDLLKLRWSDINDNRIFYQMSKNHKSSSLVIPNKAMKILNYYQNEKRTVNDYIFPELKYAKEGDAYDIHRKIRTANKKFNDHLKKLGHLAGIHKKITMHIARHSFGNIAGDRISPQMLQKLYRHTSLNTTIMYQGNFIYKSADDALKTVIGD